MAIDPGQIIDDPRYPQSTHLLFKGREFVFFRILTAAKEMDLVIKLSQCLGEIEGVDLYPCIFLWRKAMADLKDLHTSK
jgi:hypothetical protein